jgi:hypothetical protein
MRRYPAAFFLVFCLFFLTSPLAAQLPPKPLPPPVVKGLDPQAMSILKAAFAAMSCQGAASIQDTVVQATVTPPASMGSDNGTATITTKGAAKLRTDGTLGSKSSSFIYNNGQELRYDGKAWHTAHSANAIHKRIEHLPALMLAYEISRSDLAAAYIGQETLEGRAVQHIRLARTSNDGTGADETLTRNSQLDVYVDAQTNQISRISFLYLSDTDWRRGLPMDIYYDGYSTVNGIAVPFHQRYFFAGRPNGELQINSVSVNQGPSDSLFKGN